MKTVSALLVVIFLIYPQFSCTRYKRSYAAPTFPQLKKALDKRSITSIRTRGKIDAMLSKGRLKVKSFMIADNLGRIRFDALTPPPLNATLLLLTSDGSTFRALDKRNNKYLEGKASSCAVNLFMGVPLAPLDLYRVLLGDSLIQDGKTKISWDSDCGCEVLSGKSGNMDVKVWISGKNGRKGWKIVKQTIKTPSGTIKIEYRGYKKIKGINIPFRIRLSKSGKKGDTIFVWNKFESNPEVEPDAFNQNPPAGYEVNRIICGEGEKSRE